MDYQEPLVWALLLAWILSVVLHEFAHGIVAYFGGDYTVRERGGLTLNPLQYIDPVFSLVVPAIIFIVGGVPLPGGVTYIRRDLIRNRAWQVGVSAAGPAMNFLIFLALVLPFHPSLGWIEPPPLGAGVAVSNAMLFVGAMAWLQMLSVLFNLVPVPPLDGFGIVSQFMDEETRHKLGTPPVSTTAFFIFFIMLWQAPKVMQGFHRGVSMTLDALGFDAPTIDFFGRAFNQTLFGA